MLDAARALAALIADGGSTCPSVNCLQFATGLGSSTCRAGTSACDNAEVCVTNNGDVVVLSSSSSAAAAAAARG